MRHHDWRVSSWASYQIRNIVGCACAGNAGNIFPRRQFQRKLLVSDPGMHHGTCVTHVPWWMSRSLTSDGGENDPGIPGACAPAILRIWQEAHVDGLCHHVDGAYPGTQVASNHRQLRWWLDCMRGVTWIMLRSHFASTNEQLSFGFLPSVSLFLSYMYDCMRAWENKVSFVDTFRPRQNGHHFADDMLRYFFIKENGRISIDISLKIIPEGQIKNIPPIGSDNGLAPTMRQAIIWTNVGKFTVACRRHSASII